jgi:hypothetical protein
MNAAIDAALAAARRYDLQRTAGCCTTIAEDRR